MKRLCFLILVLTLCMASSAQRSKRNTTQRRQSTTRVQQNKKRQPTERERMQADQQRLKNDIAKKKRQKQELDRRVRQQMQDMMVLGNEIDMKRLTIDSIRIELDTVNAHKALLDSQLVCLQRELAERQENYRQSVRYMHRNRKMQNKMMFIFSAKNMNQMYRRTRFMNEYATYQRAQGEAVKQKQEQVEQKQAELDTVKAQITNLLHKGEAEQRQMEAKKREQQTLVDQLKQEQQTVQTLLAKEQREEAELNAKIERLIAEEIAREKARIEAEKRRKAEEAARKERERKERERQLAEAKERERKAKAEARAARNAEEKKAAKQRQQAAENERKTVEREISNARRESSYTAADPDQRLSGSFSNNKGRLPMPITGNYQIVRGFGANVAEGVGRGVHLPSKGIHLKGQPGAQARCVFDGQVSSIFANGNTYIVMVRHGKYISVYCDLASVSVSTGQRVSTNQTLGKLGPEHTMQFQLRNWTELLDPRPWLRR